MTADVSTLPSAELRELNAEIGSLMGRYRVTQTELAAYLGLTQVSVSDRLNGKTDWKAAELIQVAHAFGRHVAELWGGQAPHGGGPDDGAAARRADDGTRTRNILLGMPQNGPQLVQAA